MNSELKQPINILVLGSGGREDALAWKLSESPLCKQMFIAPGNGASREGLTRLSFKPDDFMACAEHCCKYEIDLLVVGPEQPLVEGLVDYLLKREDLKGLHIVGPTSAGAMLEGSKDFAKAFMLRHHIPTAKFKTIDKTTIAEGEAFLDSLKPPYVLKADGLAAGKGVVILDSLPAAKKELRNMLDGKFGKAGSQVLIEEFLCGIECSCFVLTDGKHYRLLPSAKDYKRVGEGDTGLNTGGMGAVSPVPFLTEDLEKKIIDKVIKPTVKGLSDEAIAYKGFIFVGLMICEGEPYVIEYNCRMGDPETEVVMPRVDEDLVPHLLSLKDQNLKEGKAKEKKGFATTIIMTSGGYPESYQTGYVISGLAEASKLDKVQIFHAGTKRDAGGNVLTSGGRVLAVTGRGDDLSSALRTAYGAVGTIGFESHYHRRDIGEDLLMLMNKEK